MSEFIAWIFGIVSGLALWFYNDTKYNPYIRGFADGYKEAMYERKKNGTEESVRCKDCKWFGKSGCAIHIVDESDKPKEDDFCSWAERKEE